MKEKKVTTSLLSIDINIRKSVGVKAPRTWGFKWSTPGQIHIKTPFIILYLPAPKTKRLMHFTSGIFTGYIWNDGEMRNNFTRPRS